MKAESVPPRLPAAILACLLMAACASPEEVLLPEDKRDPLFHDIADQELPAAEQAVQSALESQPSGTTAEWRGSNGAHLEVTPLRTFKIATGHFCRDYRVIVQSVGLTRAAARTACRTEEGLWLEVKPATSAAPQ